MTEINGTSKRSKLEKLYSLATGSLQSRPPKHSLFSRKCPECGGRVNKETVTEPILGITLEDEFINRVMADAELAPGVYDLEIVHFTCQKCAYEFATRTVSDLREET